MTSRQLIIFLLVSVIAVNALGFFAFGMMDHDMTDNCPVMNFIVGQCPQHINPFSMVTHHMNGLRALLLGIIASESLILLVVLIIARLLFAPHQPSVVHHTVISPQTDTPLIPYREFFHWLALHNKHDAIRHSGCMI